MVTDLFQKNQHILDHKVGPNLKVTTGYLLWVKILINLRNFVGIAELHCSYGGVDKYITFYILINFIFLSL